VNHLKINDINNILILGAGTMGLRISLGCALHGYQCVIYDVHPHALERAKTAQAEILERLLKSDQINPSQAELVSSAQTFTTDASEAAKNADLVSESVTEDVLVKNQVWEQFGQLCPEHAVFTTNTSYLLPSMFANISGRPERFCALHFHDVFHAKVVDIMPHSSTEAWVVPLLRDFGSSIQQIPVVLEKEVPGYLFNNMLMALIGSAGALLIDGAGTIEDIDRSWMGNFNTPNGPFGILDEVGLDTAWHIVRVRKDRKSRQFAELLHSYVREGNLGQKTGSGFYDYPNPRYRDQDFL